MIECTVHLFSLKPDATPNQVISQLKAENQSVLLSGVPHGWIHKPHTNNVDQLLASEWHLFVLTQARNHPVPFDRSVEAHISIKVSIPEEEQKQLSRAASDHPPRSAPKLPPEWFNQNTGDLHIPSGQVTIQTEDIPPAGTLKLDSSMANFLSTALPQPVGQKPVSLFNLFKYRNGDSTIHEQYMRDFKDSFGDSAGAFVKLMGLVTSQLRSIEEEQQQRGTGSWQEANLTHYDSIYHYAYMLSTDVYRRLNEDKVRGLEDTCILLVSEVELESEERDQR